MIVSAVVAGDSDVVFKQQIQAVVRAEVQAEAQASRKRAKMTVTTFSDVGQNVLDHSGPVVDTMDVFQSLWTSAAADVSGLDASLNTARTAWVAANGEDALQVSSHNLLKCTF